MKFTIDKYFLLSLLLASSANADYRDVKEEGTKIPGEFVVVLQEENRRHLKGTDTDELEVTMNTMLNDITASVGAGSVTTKSVYTKAILGFELGCSEADAKKIAASPDVEFVEPNQKVFIDETWGIDRVDQRNLPLSDSFSPMGTGSGVTAYILDTGVQITHDEFGNRATWGENTSGDGEDRDCNGHGTHVAGTVGGTLYGVAKQVNIVAVKVLSCSGSGTTAGVINGVEWTMDDAVGKKATANMSLGGGFSSALNNAVKNLNDSGVPTVVAAGNNNGDACSKSPASEPEVITVGSTTSSDARSGFSNYGTCLDIFAPGSSITAAWIGNDSATNTISGTSMASPHVCGGAALLLEAGVAPADVRDGLVNRATPDKVTDPKAGSPNLLLYVGAVGPTQPPTLPPPTPAPTPCQGDDLEVIVVTDNYPGETSWTLKNLCTDGEQASSGSYPQGQTEYIEEACVPTAEYEFTISDTYGDGMCCSYGNGSYKVSYNGALVKEGGQFGGSESITWGDCNAVQPTNPAPQPTAPAPQPTNPAPEPTAPVPAPTAPEPQPTNPAPTPTAPVPAPTTAEEFVRISAFQLVQIERDNGKFKAKFKFAIRNSDGDRVDNASVNVSITYDNETEEKTCETNSGFCVVKLRAYDPDDFSEITATVSDIVDTESGLAYNAEENKKNSDGCPLFSSGCPSVDLEASG